MRQSELGTVRKVAGVHRLVQRIHSKVSAGNGISWTMSHVPLTVYVIFRAIKLGYLNQDMIDYYDPMLMFAIPRLAVVW